MLGGLDVLIANAGLAGSGANDREDWRYVIETNLIGCIGCDKKAVSRMKRRSQGHIVLIGSMSANARRREAQFTLRQKPACRGSRNPFARKSTRKGFMSACSNRLCRKRHAGRTPDQQRAKIRKHEMLRAEDVAAAVHYILPSAAMSLFYNCPPSARLSERRLDTPCSL